MMPQRGDRVRQPTWSHCYLFVRKTCVGNCHMIGTVYEPTADGHVIKRDEGVWEIGPEWELWTPESQRHATPPLP